MWSLVDEDKLKPWTIYSFVIYHKLSNNRGCEQSKREIKFPTTHSRHPKSDKKRGEREDFKSNITFHCLNLERSFLQSTRSGTQRTR